MKSHEQWSVHERDDLGSQAPDDIDFPSSPRELLDAVPAAIYATDAAGRVTYFNPAAVELSGGTPELGTDQWCVGWRLYWPDETPIAQADCPMAVALREGRSIRGQELIVERPDGTRIACMPYPTPLRGADGTVIGGINLLVDISDRMRAESDLHDSEQRFVQFMQNLPGLAWIKDEQGHYMYANAAAERAFEAPLDQLLGLTDAELFSPATAAEFAANDRRVLESGCGMQTIETLEHSDGAVHHSIVSKFPLPARDGSTLIGGVAIDVTELKQTEAALRRSEAWFRTLAEASPALIWRVDPAGGFTYVNPPYLEYFGRHEDEVLDRGWFPLLHPDDASAYMAAVDAAQRDRSRLCAAVRVRHRNGDWRWIESYALPLFNDGQYLGHIGTSLDITERKQVEEALSEADSRKDEFLAMLAHELRGPLAPIRNSIEILRRTAAPETGTVVQTLDRQVRHLVRLVDDLLDVSRISRGRIELRREQVDLRAVVQQAVEAVGPLCRDLDQSLTVGLPAEPALVDGDPARLAQVLGNLLNNATKFTGRGGRISICIDEPSSSPAGSVLVRVRDTGIGIAPEQFARIFDLFTQVDTSLERVGGGLGIGLTLVKTLVGMHGGMVEVRSAGIDQGSEFVVRLPRVEAARSVAGNAGSDATAASAPRRILVVDDNRDSAESLCTLLRLRGHEVAAAFDGLEAVEAACRFRAEVVLLDIGLPKLNGYQAARRIRERLGDRCPVLVALTGWGQESDRRASRAAGFDAHLVKPVDDATLARVLAEAGAR